MTRGRPHDALLTLLEPLAVLSGRYSTRRGRGPYCAAGAFSRDFGKSDSYLAVCRHRGYIHDARIVFVLRRLCAFYGLSEAMVAEEAA